MSAQGDVCPGWCLSRGCPAKCMLGYTSPHPPWTEFLTHACENITFLQLRLRTVKIGHTNNHQGQMYQFHVLAPVTAPPPPVIFWIQFTQALTCMDRSYPTFSRNPRELLEMIGKPSLLLCLFFSSIRACLRARNFSIYIIRHYCVIFFGYFQKI